MASKTGARFEAVQQRLGVRLRRATFAIRRLLVSRVASMEITHEQ